jgi:uncharacterized protein (DUF4415 family)
MSKKSISTAFDDDQPISEEDIASGKLILRKRVEGRAVQPKKRVTLYLDATLVEHFKELAGERGYQTLINDTLKESLLHVDIEVMLRKVIREELRRKQSART